WRGRQHAMIDPCQLRPRELCRLLNSTALGEVLSERQLHQHKTRAGLHIGDGRHVNLIRYVAWLVRLPPTSQPEAKAPTLTDLGEARRSAARVACGRVQSQDRELRLTRKQEALIAALLVEPTHAAAAAKAGVSEATLYRWLKQPAFCKVFCQARHRLFAMDISRMYTAAGEAVRGLLASR